MTSADRRRWVVGATGIAISAAFGYLTFRDLDWSSINQSLSQIAWPILALTLGTKGLAFLALAARSRVTTAAAGPLAFDELLRAHLFGFTANNVLPLRAGELLRIDFLARRTGTSRTLLLSTVAAERLLDTAFLLVLFICTGLMVLGLGILTRTVLALAALTVLGGGLAVWAGRGPGLQRTTELVTSRLGPRGAAVTSRYTRQFGLGLSAFAHRTRLVQASVATVAYWACGFGSLWVVALAVGLGLPWWGPALILAFVALGTALPAAPGFVGTYHYFAALALTSLGVSDGLAASYAIVAHAMAIGPYTLVGLVMFASSLLRRKARADSRPTTRVPPADDSTDSGRATVSD